MKAAALQLKNRMEQVDILNNIPLRKNIFKIMCGGFAFLSICYVFFLASMVFNIVERKALEKQALTLSNEVSDMELSYLSLTKSIDVSMSNTMGFTEAHANFATRKNLGSIVLPKNEI